MRGTDARLGAPAVAGVAHGVISEVQPWNWGWGWVVGGGWPGRGILRPSFSVIGVVLGILPSHWRAAWKTRGLSAVPGKREPVLLRGVSFSAQPGLSPGLASSVTRRPTLVH